MRTLRQRLEEVRRRAFFGRREELALFRRALVTPGVMFVYGPGGIGKSALLDAYAHLAGEAGREVLRVDARHLTLSPEGLPKPSGDRPVLLIDTYELLEPIDDWIRTEYLPSLPADALVVLAGRRAPGVSWRADPAWREVVVVRALGNLSPEDARAYLVAQAVPEASQDRLLRIARGHPLTLSMLVEALHRGAEMRALSDLPDVVSALLAQTIGEAPSRRHRRALEICAHVPVTTEDLLRSVTGDEADDLFAWLRSLPFVEEGPYGLFPHDVVRDALDADLRWRDPESYAAMSQKLSQTMVGRIRAVADPGERLRMVVESIVLSGARSRVETCSVPPPTLQARVDDLRGEDRGPIIDMTRAWQGAEQAALVAFWMDRAPSCFRVFREPSGRPRGYAACLELSETGLGDDPGAQAMWRYVQDNAPPRPGEKVRAWRFFLDGEHGQRSSPSVTLFAACQTLDHIIHSDTAWTLVGAYADAGQWDVMMENLDFRRTAKAEYTIDGTVYPIYAHDWRRIDVPQWINLVQARQAHLPSDPIENVVLSQPEFTEAVRAALHDLSVPEKLQHNPLLGTRMVRHHTKNDRDQAHVLDELIRTAAATLPSDLDEVVTQTFLRSSRAQERVAEALHLSFNTYRRRRDKAVAALTEWLWDRETHPRDAW